MSRIKTITIVVLGLLLAALALSPALCRSSRTGSLKFVRIDGKTAARKSHKYIVVITHGWIQKGAGDWPQDMAEAISSRVDPNLWLCGYFDWSKGAMTINPKDAARYGYDTAGVVLAEQILKLAAKVKHVHLVGHSSGCWTITRAAKILAERTRADIHLTFLDAYIPAGWDQSRLGDVNMPDDADFWADHYYTRDYTQKLTAQDLTHAHNVDLTDIDQLIKDHNFPWKWYYATITGTFGKWSFLDEKKLVTDINDLAYGFARSREAAGSDGWQNSLDLPVGNKALKLAKKQNHN